MPNKPIEEKADSDQPDDSLVEDKILATIFVGLGVVGWTVAILIKCFT